MWENLSFQENFANYAKYARKEGPHHASSTRTTPTAFFPPFAIAFAIASTATHDAASPSAMAANTQ